MSPRRTLPSVCVRAGSAAARRSIAARGLRRGECASPGSARRDAHEPAPPVTHGRSTGAERRPGSPHGGCRRRVAPVDARWSGRPRCHHGVLLSRVLLTWPTKNAGASNAGTDSPSRRSAACLTHLFVVLFAGKLSRERVAAHRVAREGAARLRAGWLASTPFPMSMTMSRSHREAASASRRRG